MEFSSNAPDVVVANRYVSPDEGKGPSGLSTRVR